MLEAADPKMARVSSNAEVVADAENRQTETNVSFKSIDRVSGGDERTIGPSGRVEA